MVRVTSTDDTLDAHPDPVESLILQHYSRAVHNLKGAVNDESHRDYATLHLIAGLADAIEQAVQATHTTAGRDRLHSKQPLALGGGTSRPTPQLEALSAHADALDALTDEGQKRGRGMLISQVVDGSFPVDEDGMPAVQLELDRVQAELGNAQRAKTAAEARTTAAEAQRDAALQGSDPDITAAWQNLSDVERRHLKRPVLDVVEGRVSVDASGNIGTNTALVTERDNLVTDKTALTTKVAELQAVIDDLKAHAKNGLNGNTSKKSFPKVADLKPETKAAMGW